jgi:hypothetical protein
VQQRRAEIKPVWTVTPVEPDHRHGGAAQERQQIGKRRDRPPCRRNVDADMGEPAVGVTKVILHVDYDDRGAREIEGHDAVVGADGDRTRLRWNANEVGVSDADVPLIAGSGTERHQLWLLVH